jgi:hypothetical protein
MSSDRTFSCKICLHKPWKLNSICETVCRRKSHFLRHLFGQNQAHNIRLDSSSALCLILQHDAHVAVWCTPQKQFSQCRWMQTWQVQSPRQPLPCQWSRNGSSRLYPSHSSGPRTLSRAAHHIVDKDRSQAHSCFVCDRGMLGYGTFTLFIVHTSCSI